jgi:hypothetical protein
MRAHEPDLGALDGSWESLLKVVAYELLVTIEASRSQSYSVGYLIRATNGSRRWVILVETGKEAKRHGDYDDSL